MAFNKYIEKNGKKYRMGYTTGSAAAGAAKAATEMLMTGQLKENVKIVTPAGIELDLKLLSVELNSCYARAAIIKDAGDDPDVTDGIKIYARVGKISEDKVVIKGGQGVGKVTKPGLPIAVGKAAINPVPRKMIKKAVKEVLPAGQGVKVIIEIPAGEEIARKTFNSKLGIKGGISILGTTGIVEPMSRSAYRESLAVELKQAVALGYKELVFVFGNHGKKIAIKLGYKEEKIIRMSNFVGYMLDQCLNLDINKILLIGHIGKIVKVAGGIYNTHSKEADARMEIIAAHAALYGAQKRVIKEIFAANTAEEAGDILLENNFKEVFNYIAKRVVARVKERVNNKFIISSIVFSMEKGILGSYGVKKEEINYE